MKLQQWGQRNNSLADSSPRWRHLCSLNSDDSQVYLSRLISMVATRRFQAGRRYPMRWHEVGHSIYGI